MASKYLIYGRTTCPYCIAATELLEESHKKTVFIDLTTDPEGIEEAKEFYGWPTVPIILENDEDTGAISFVGGFSDLTAKLESE